MDHDELLDLIAGAREEVRAHEYLLAVAAALIHDDQPLPGPLKEFVIGFLRNPEGPRRGPGRKRDYIRDEVTAFAVSHICLNWKFSPTRNEATTEPSAVSIVKRALEEIDIYLTEAAITKIWDKSFYKDSTIKMLAVGRKQG